MPFIFDKLKRQYGGPIYGDKGKSLAPIPDRKLPKELIEQLKSLTRAKKVEQKTR